MENIAFIDGQNLHLGTTQDNWKIDLYKFRTYLTQKHNVSEAYYFIGYISDNNREIYNNIQRAGFIMLFKEHNINSLGKKKGNVDSDIIFEMMRTIIDNTDFEKIILVSGDGDYKKVVDYLISKNKFAKILFPNRRFRSSLYRGIGSIYTQYLDDDGVRKKIEYTKS